MAALFLSLPVRQKGIRFTGSIWHFLARQFLFCRHLWWLLEPALQYGALLTCWRDTEMTIQGLMLMCRKVTHKNLRDSSPLFFETQDILTYPAFYFVFTTVDR